MAIGVDAIVIFSRHAIESTLVGALLFGLIPAVAWGLAGMAALGMKLRVMAPVPTAVVIRR